MCEKEVIRFNAGFVVGKKSECWNWLGWKVPSGYGGFYMKRGNRRTFNSHRIAWSLANGKDIPDGMMICHTCDNRLCVNPTHLYLGTGYDNNGDTVKRGRANRTLGEKCSWSTLTENDVIEIRRSKEKRPVLAKKYGVTRWHIRNIKANKALRHIAS